MGCPESGHFLQAKNSPTPVGNRESQAALHTEKAPPSHPIARGEPPSSRTTPPQAGPRGPKRRRHPFLTCRRPGAHLGGEGGKEGGRRRIQAVDASGRGAAESPGLRGTGGRWRHPRGRPQEVGPPTHPWVTRRDSSRPSQGPAPEMPRPLAGARPPQQRPPHHREELGA